MNMKFYSLIFSLVLILSWSTTAAQQEDYKKNEKKKEGETQLLEYNSTNNGKKWDWSKARIGGNFGISYSTGALFVDLSPTFGYKINKVVEVGGGFKMLYYRDKYATIDLVNTFEYKSITYGPMVFGRFTVWDGVFLAAQYEMANKNPIANVTRDNFDSRINVHHLLIGGGYSQSLGQAGNLNISLLYDVIDDPNSNYQFGTFGSFPLILNISAGFGINRRK